MCCYNQRMDGTAPDKPQTYALILIHQDGSEVVFESGITKERAEEMQTILRGFITDVRVIEQP
jgi:hypothetical protein